MITKPIQFTILNHVNNRKADIDRTQELSFFKGLLFLVVSFCLIDQSANFFHQNYRWGVFYLYLTLLIAVGLIGFITAYVCYRVSLSKIGSKFRVHFLLISLAIILLLILAQLQGRLSTGQIAYLVCNYIIAVLVAYFTFIKFNSKSVVREEILDQELKLRKYKDRFVLIFLALFLSLSVYAILLPTGVFTQLELAYLPNGSMLKRKLNDSEIHLAFNEIASTDQQQRVLGVAALFSSEANLLPYEKEIRKLVADNNISVSWWALKVLFKKKFLKKGDSDLVRPILKKIDKWRGYRTRLYLKALDVIGRPHIDIALPVLKSLAVAPCFSKSCSSRKKIVVKLAMEIDPSLTRRDLKSPGTILIEDFF